MTKNKEIKYCVSHENPTTVYICKTPKRQKERYLICLSNNVAKLQKFNTINNYEKYS